LRSPHNPSKKIFRRHYEQIEFFSYETRCDIGFDCFGVDAGQRLRAEEMASKPGYHLSTAALGDLSNATEVSELRLPN